jgi:DNA-binding transcriptional ArsR family regulator
VEAETAKIDEAAFVRALAHPLRLRILAMLDERPSSPARLAAALGARINVVAYHVKRLRELDLVELVDVRRGRGGLEHFYVTRRHPTFSDIAWRRLGVGERARVLVPVLRQLWEYVTRSAVAGGFERPEAHLSRTPLRLDEAGWRALAAAAMGWLEDVAAIERDVSQRGSGELFDAGLVLMLFEARPFSRRPSRPPRSA